MIFGGSQRMLVVGRVLQLSGDKQRFRLEAGQYRTTLPTMDCDLKPGDTALAIVAAPTPEKVTVQR